MKYADAVRLRYARVARKAKTEILNESVATMLQQIAESVDQLFTLAER